MENVARPAKRDGSRRIARLGLGLLTGGLLLAPGLAHAVAPLPGDPTGALHIGKRALDVITQIAIDRFPGHLVLPDLTHDLLSCPSGIQITQGYVDVKPKSLSFTPADGSLGIAARMDLSGYAHVDIRFGSSCYSAQSCDVGFAATDLAPNAAVQLSVTDGQPTVGLGDLSVTVAPGGLHLDIQNCALDLIPDSVLNALGQALITHAQGPIGDQLRGSVPPLVQAQLASMLGTSGTVGGYGFNATLTDLKMTASGIDAYAAIGVDYEGPVAVCLPPDDGSTAVAHRATTGSTLSLPANPTSSVVVGVSTDLLSNAIKAAWQSGLLCIDDGAIAKLGFDPDKLAALVPGMPEGMTMHFAVALDSAPTVDSDTTGAVRMHVKGAELLLSMSSPGQATAGVAVSTDFTVGVLPSVDPISGAVYATLADMSVEHMELHAGASGSDYSLDPERLTVLMRDVVMPMANDRLRGMPLSPAAFGMAGIYGWLNNLTARNDGVYVGLEIFQPGPASADTELPQTLLQKNPGRLVRAGMAQFQVSGTDDTTPFELLRYQWQVDDGPLSIASFSRTISAPVTTAGAHTFRVRAVDLYEKADAGFQTYSFELDPVAPTLQILEQPDVVLRGGSASVRLTGSDDRSTPDALSYAYRVEARPAGGETTLFAAAAQPTKFVAGAGEIHIEGLKESTTYEMTVLLYDEAGNVTSQTIGFGVASTSGCSMSSRAGDSPAALLLLAIGLLIVVRRRTSIPR